ncbi:hypothetical protein SAMN02745704_01057 [Paucidesulfovibrio gracilis DSM 16080]|uniref:Lipoprotein n=1 Tax=Paucidesulfovibrio gracilis DSM 16080 TaxID=1121449 RepID=A0A1T4WLX7_9BACT|nr:hypothetical protein SAMN02745704_01057 [Paucidesulfovibrio gracilis DSM 16080]
MRHFMVWLCLMTPCLVVCGCSIRDASVPETLRKYRMVSHPTPRGFDVCDRFGCRGSVGVSLTAKQWSQVRSLLAPAAESPSTERRSIAQAVALLESFVGVQVGTSADVAKNDHAGAGQLDCVAESVNTSVYLFMLERDGLLRHHEVAPPTKRGTFIFYPHNTAVLLERASGRAFAVDSWFRDNGLPPYVVPLKVWRSGWRPEDGTDGLDSEDDMARQLDSEEGHGVS